DRVALAEVEEIVSAAGGTVTVADTAPAGGVVVHLGAGTDTLEEALAALGTEAVAEPEGYVVANGEVDGASTLVLAGADPRGTYYATQTLRQVVSDGVVPA